MVKGNASLGNQYYQKHICNRLEIVQLKISRSSLFINYIQGIKCGRRNNFKGFLEPQYW